MIRLWASWAAIKGAVQSGGRGIVDRDTVDLFAMLKFSLLLVLLAAISSSWAMNLPLEDQELLDFVYQDALARNGRVALRAPVSSQ